MINVRKVDPREIIKLLIKYLYTELEPGEKAVFIASKFGVKRNFGLREKISPLALIDVIAFQ